MAGAASLVLASCDGTCTSIPSCVPQPAIRLIVTSAATGGPVQNVAVQVSPSYSGAVACSVEASVTVCTVLGGLGEYSVAVGAPGYQTTQKTVTVGGVPHRCNCPTVRLSNVVIALQPV